MNFKNIKDELKDILQGKSTVSHGTAIQAAASHLRKSKKTSRMAQKNEPNREEETKELIHYINTHCLWKCDINFNSFISQYLNLSKSLF